MHQGHPGHGGLQQLPELRPAVRLPPSQVGLLACAARARVSRCTRPLLCLGVAVATLSLALMVHHTSPWKTCPPVLVFVFPGLFLSITLCVCACFHSVHLTSSLSLLHSLSLSLLLVRRPLAVFVGARWLTLLLLRSLWGHGAEWDTCTGISRTTTPRLAPQKSFSAVSLHLRLSIPASFLP